MNYHPKTQALIERMCQNVERKYFVLDKINAEECLLKTYDLFNLKRPSKVIWKIDIFDKDFTENLNKASSAWAAWAAWVALSALALLEGCS